MKHHFHLSYKAITISLLTILFAFQCHSFAQKGTEVKGYGAASCSDFSDNIFIKDWLILGPIGIPGQPEGNIDAAAVKKAFDEDILTSVAIDKEKSIAPISYSGNQYTWKPYKSGKDIIELYKFLGDTNFIVCYALTEIVTAEAKTALIGLGSDDGVKVWLNGKEVHKNNNPRAVTIDDDIFEITLNKGSNQILIKILNEQYGYGFSFRPLGKDLISDLLIQSSGSGDFDNVKTLMKYSPDLKNVNNQGLTAWQLATIKGRIEITQYLEKNGADKNTNFPSINDYVDRTLAPFNGKDSVSGLAVLIAKNGNILYQKGFGNANIKKKLPVSTDTKFRIGSITKQFTAAAILRLQEQGKIYVNDKLSSFLPDFPRGNEVTIHQLLTHTSGIHSYTNRNDFEGNMTKATTDKDLIKIIESDTFDFNPGDQWSYCNSGYFILGHIISKISGKSYSEYLSDEFFKPLGMKNSGVYNNKRRPENEAIGYTYDNGRIFISNDWEMSWAGGAGAIYSTVEDLYLWNEAIFNGKVLNENSLKMAFTPVKLNNGEQAGPLVYGYGWMLPEYRGMKAITHGGGLDGFISYLLRQPEEKLTITILTNATPPYMNFEPQRLCAEMAEYMLWQKLTSQVAYSVDTTLTADKLNVYSGNYDYGNGMILTVSLDGEHLMAQMNGQPAFEIFYMGNNEFYWKVVEARIKFMLNDQGVITGATHYQGGQQLNVSKMPAN